MKSLMKRLCKYAIITAIGILLFIIINDAETVRRGYRAVGSEGIFLFTPVFYILGKSIAREIQNPWQNRKKCVRHEAQK